MLTANSLRDLFGISPLPLLQNHLEFGIQCSEQLPQMLEAMFEGDTGTLQALKFTIHALAQQADEVSSELMHDWPKGVFVPTRRRDVLLVLESQERIIDAAQGIATLTQLGLEIPSEIRRMYVTLAGRCVELCRQLHRVIESLDIALRTGIDGPDRSHVYRLVEDVRKKDKEVRMLSDDLAETLYEGRNDEDVVSLVFVFRLADLFGGLSRHAKVAGQRALLLISR